MTAVNAPEMKLNWGKSDGLVPAIIQDAESGRVLMLGYMSAESLELTRKSGKVTFYSRTRQSIWLKGETSGNYLNVVEISPDCDQDALLIRARPDGPTCHRGTETCFEETASSGGISFLNELHKIIQGRFKERPKGSYVTSLIEDGLDRMAQKVGEEAIETVIASKNPGLTEFEGEASDLVFHLMVLLEARGSSLAKLSEFLRKRHSK
jgi:phosphoribosyl-ATP pyrophosphohydrolase/phosphoribosyl-AMP cyclohydrolase